MKYSKWLPVYRQIKRNWKARRMVARIDYCTKRATLLPLFWHITNFSPLIRQLLFISFIASTGTVRGKMKYKCHMLHLELPINIYNIGKNWVKIIFEGEIWNSPSIAWDIQGDRTGHGQLNIKYVNHILDLLQVTTA